MTRMRVRQLTSCRHHRRPIIILEDVGRHVALTFYADPDDARRLARELDRGRKACGLLQTLGATPSRVVLDDVNGEGIGGTLFVRLERLRPEDFG